jgi:hypothetical protein
MFKRSNDMTSTACYQNLDVMNEESLAIMFT